ncbi:hypothetical protein [Pimelobacter simplex]|nr:hypothetical protein [Pimelobacter simplex]
MSGAELLETLRSTNATEYLLVNPDGTMYGVLVTTDVLRRVRPSR